MSTAPPTDHWVQGHDQYGARCWRHELSREIRYSKPSLQWLSTGTNPNVARTAEFRANTGSAAGAWTEYTEASTGRPYWHNKVTNLTTWHKPNGVF